MPPAPKMQPNAKQALPDKMIQLERILVATDFSSASNRALDYAVSLARRY